MTSPPVSGSVDCIDDPALPTLAVVLDPSKLGEHLREPLALPTKGLNRLQVRVLRHHPTRREHLWRHRRVLVHR